MCRVVQPFRRLPGAANGLVGDRSFAVPAGVWFIHACIQIESPFRQTAPRRSENRVDAPVHAPHAAKATVLSTAPLAARTLESHALVVLFCPVAG
jgi:hypothetical protein